LDTSANIDNLELQEADIEEAASRVALRPHCRETIERALQCGWRVHVLSVNWSAALVKAAMGSMPCRVFTEANALDPLGEEFQGHVMIHANSLDMQLGISTGKSCKI
jgi:hypothetical protein